MNSGKTTKILQCDYNYEEKGMRAVIMKPATDTKGEDKIVSRIGSSKKVDYLIKNDENIFDKVTKDGKLHTAIKNCEYMESLNEDGQASQRNPMTKVYKIVDGLKEYLE